MFHVLACRQYYINVYLSQDLNHVVQLDGWYCPRWSNVIRVNSDASGRRCGVRGAGWSHWTSFFSRNYLCLWRLRE